ncbi:MAG: PqiC family protein [Steroidobacteraceae bacterium]
MRPVAIALILLLAGCASSPPVRFYTLAPVAPARHPPPAARITVQIAAVHIPVVLDRQEMVRESAPETLQVSDGNRWGAPLADMIQRVLTQDLAARLLGSTVLAPQALPPAGTRVLVLDVLRFEVGPSGRAALEGSWSLFATDSGQALLIRRVSLTSRQSAGSYRGQAAAMSRLLGRLADRIAAALVH